MNRKSVVFSIVLVTGVLGVAAGFLPNIVAGKQVSGLLIGAGAGLVGMSLSNLLMIRMERKNPALTKQAEIERRDERNRMLRDRAKAAAGEGTALDGNQYRVCRDTSGRAPMGYACDRRPVPALFRRLSMPAE